MTDLDLEMGDQISTEMAIDDGWQGVCVSVFACLCLCVFVFLGGLCCGQGVA